MAKGRPRKPTNVLEITGAFKANQNRQRPNEPIDIPAIGAPPDWLDDDEKSAWMYLAERCPAGVLGNSDEIALEIAARLFAQMRARTLDCAKEKGGIDRSGTHQLIEILSKLGMTPADRSRVSVFPREGKKTSEESYFARSS